MARIGELVPLKLYMVKIREVIAKFGVVHFLVVMHFLVAVHFCLQ